jgi:anti-sigma B factor antagonist
METSIDDRGGVTVVRIAGSVDSVTSEALQRVFSGQLEAGRARFVADFGGVEYTSSAGLRVLLATVKQSRARGGDLLLAAPNPEVRNVLELSGFTGILRVFASVDDAVRGFGGS